jgi:Peptidyl-prolyl cis-trans isomerase (rotamase) - cyclophilin family
MKIKLLSIALIVVAFCACNNGKKNQQQAKQTETEVMKEEVKQPVVNVSEEPVFDVVTTLGTIRIKLYKETPKHRDNFVKLATSGYYDGVLFHRVINNFMIQTGDPDSKNAPANAHLGMGGPDYKIDAEILPQFSHKKGTVAAARQGDQVNPEKKSSGSQFYIVQNQNGTPHLDGDYTVFGETISGLDVIDKIANVAVGQGDRPVEDVKIEKIIIVE